MLAKKTGADLEQRADELASSIVRPLLRTFADLSAPARTFLARRVAHDIRAQLLIVRDEERQLISDELHDSTVQYLVAANLSLMRLKSRIKNENSNLEILSDIEKSVDRALKELRSSTYLMHPPDLEDGPFSVMLQEYCEEFSRRTDIAVELRCERAVDSLTSQVHRAILRIIQEALMNVHRHADATRAVVRIRQRNSFMHVVVSNNGKAKSKRPVGRAKVGVGLSSIRLRLSQFGGSLMVMTAQRGTVLHGVIPIDRLIAEGLNQSPCAPPTRHGRRTG